MLCAFQKSKKQLKNKANIKKIKVVKKAAAVNNIIELNKKIAGSTGNH